MNRAFSGYGCHGTAWLPHSAATCLKDREKSGYKPGKGKAMSKYGHRHQNWFEAIVNKLGGEDGAEAFLRGELEVVRKKTLTVVRKVNVAAQPPVTTSEEWFKEAGVGLMGDNFKAQFLDLEVPATEEAEFTVRKLEQASVDDPIIKELGGKEKAEILPSQFRAFLATNRESPEWFIFYLKGKDGNLWAVDARWRDFSRDWRVRAGSLDDPVEWGGGHRVLSR